MAISVQNKAYIGLVSGDAYSQVSEVGIPTGITLKAESEVKKNIRRGVITLRVPYSIANQAGTDSAVGFYQIHAVLSIPNGIDQYTSDQIMVAAEQSAKDFAAVLFNLQDVGGKRLFVGAHLLQDGDDFEITAVTGGA